MKKLSVSLISIGLLLLLLAGCSNGLGVKATGESPADLVIGNAKIYTMDAAGSTAEALAVKDGIIVFTGKTADLAPFIGKTTKVINLKGKMLLPGFIDAHMHPAMGAVPYLFEIALYGSNKIDEYLKMIKDFVKENPGVEAYKGAGYNRAVFDETGPRKEWLDEIVKDKPMALTSVDGHSMWVNSKALEMAGITKDTPDPAGGVIKKDPATGEPSGLLQEEGAMALVGDLFPLPTKEMYREAILWLQEWFNSVGMTTTYDAWVKMDEENYWMAYKELAEEGKLTMRFRGAWYMDPEGDVKAQVEKGLELSKLFTTDYWQVKAFKFFSDQVIEEETGFMIDAYAHRSDNWFGLKVWDTKKMQDAFTMIDKAGFQIHVHQIGDAAAKYTLEALENVQKKNGARDWRPELAHVQVITEKDKDKMGKLGVTAIVAPYWIVVDDYYWDLYYPYLGKERAENMYPVKSLIDRGINTAVHSDFFVTEPDFMWAIYSGITRRLPKWIYEDWYGDSEEWKYITDENKELEYYESGTLKPLSEKATLEDMLKVITINGAYAKFLDKVTGSIEVGKKADMVVLAADLFEIDVEEIPENEVVMTFFEGRQVFKAKK
jgi:hypothetical protein